MITGIRTAVVCEKVERLADGGANYIRVLSDPLLIDVRPGVLQVWVALQVEVDEKQSSGAVRIQAPNYDDTQPFEVPPGHRLVDISFPLTLAVEAEGILIIAVSDTARGGKPFRARWLLGFSSDARPLEEDEVAAVADVREIIVRARRSKLN